MEFIISQILGIIALILVCLGYFVNSKAKFLVLQIIANIFYAGAFLCLSVVGAGLITIISTFRCVYLYFCEKHNFKYTPHFLCVFFVFYIALGICFWRVWYDFMPIITSILFTIGFYIKNMTIMRYILIIPNAILVAYNILCLTYASAVLDFIEVIVIIVAIITNHVTKKQTALN